MRLSAEIRFDADPRRVFAMIVTPAFQEAKCVASGSIEHEVDISEHENGDVVVISRRTLRTETFPEFVRSMVGSNVRVHETQRWQPPSTDGSRAGSIEVEIHGAPVRFRGSVRLTPVETGTRWPIEGEIKASIPFISGKIEKAVEPAVRAGIQLEQHIGTTWLAEH